MEKYFKSKEFGIYKLNSLSPKDIKSYYTKELRKSDIKKSRYLNIVAKTLGFQDWSSYNELYEQALLPFMYEHDLTLSKALKPEQDFSTSSSISFSVRAIADRLFLSEKELPRKIFTAYSCKIDDYGYYDAQNIFKTQFGEKRVLDSEYVANLVKRQDYVNYKEEQELDFLIPMQVHEFQPFVNLIGDTFVENGDNQDDEYIYKLYEPVKGKVEQAEYKKIAQLLKNEFRKSKKGWLEVIPFNDSLIFLKADDGSWDFIFKNLRDEVFNSLYGGYIKHKNIPSLLNEEYDFSRWLYFGHKGEVKNLKKIKEYDVWLERDEDLAEELFYKENTNREYPSSLTLLKEYYIEKGIYSYRKKTTQKLFDGFERITLKKKQLCISPLITLDEFCRFRKDGYKQSRSTHLDTLDREDLTNGDVISVTWYDAISYCRYIEKKDDLPCRLLTKEEFEEISELGIELESIDDAKFFEWSSSFKRNHAFAISKYNKEASQDLAAHLNYKYKNIQTGFRVCYEYK